jgi:HMG (high mobility group) box
MAKIAEDWKELSLDGKAVWEQRAVEDKERYHREMQAYTGPLKVRHLYVTAAALLSCATSLCRLHTVRSSMSTLTSALSQLVIVCLGVPMAGHQYPTQIIILNCVERTHLCITFAGAKDAC